MSARRFVIFGLAAVSAMLGGVLHAASYYPLPYFTKVIRAKPGNPPGWVRPLEISLYRGYLWVYFYDYSGIGRPAQNGFREYAFVNDTPSRRAWRQNFDDIVGDAAAGYGTLVCVPCAVLFAPALLLGVLAVRNRVRASYRHKLNHCGNCGYDLTGNTSGRCPECGLAVERAG